MIAARSIFFQSSGGTAARAHPALNPSLPEKS